MDKDKIISRINRRLELDEPRNTEYAAFKDISDMKWDGVPGLKNRMWSVNYIDPTGRNLLQQVMNIFDTQKPAFDVMPRGPEDSEDAELHERWIEWQMWQMNQRGKKECYRESLRYSALNNMIAGQVEYLPHWDSKSEEIKDGAFAINLHEPSTVHYEMGNYGLRWVSTVSWDMDGSDIIDFWHAFASDTKDGKKVKSAIDEIQKILDEEDDEATLKFGYVDYTDKDNRWVYCFKNSTGSDLEDIDANDKIVFVDGANELPFINWVIVEGSSDPLLTPLHRGDLWLNVNRTESIKQSIAYRRAIFPLFKVSSVTGVVPETSYDGDQDMLVLPSGVTAEQLTPPPLDPAFNEMAAQGRALMTESTGIAGMGNMQASNTQFATINALIQLRMNELEPFKRNFEKFYALVARMFYRWLAFKKDDIVVSYRTSNAGDGMAAGQKIQMGMNSKAEDALKFDPEKLYITCTLKANNPTDKSQRYNQAAQTKQSGLPIPDQQILEELGIANPQVSIADWMKEQVQYTALATFKQMQALQVKAEEMKIQAQIQMQAQAAVQAQQQPPQGQAPSPQGPPQQPANQVQGGMGNAPGMGGQPPAMGAPDQTQTSLRPQ